MAAQMKDYAIYFDGMCIGYLSERGLRAKGPKDALNKARKLFSDPDNMLSVKVHE